MIDQRVLRFHGEQVSTFADISEYCGFWANDMVVSPRRGTATSATSASTSTRASPNSASSASSPSPRRPPIWSCSTPKGEVMQVVPDMDFPNGTVITPDGATLIVGETFGSCQTAFDMRATARSRIDGSGRRSRWPRATACASTPTARSGSPTPLTRTCVRVREGGEVTGEVDCTKRAFACMLGGEDRRTLFIMTAQTSDRFEIADETRGLHRGRARRRRGRGHAVGERPRPLSRVSSAPCAGCGPPGRAQFVLDQRETHVAVTALTETDPGTRRDVGLFDEELRELQRAHLAVGLGHRAPR